MIKSNVLTKYSNQEDKLLISKVLDKIKLCETRNKITNTNFLDSRQQKMILDLLQTHKITNYIQHGGFTNSERTCFIFYPSKINPDIVLKNINTIISAIHIKLPKELQSTYTHKNYLGGIIKLGIERNKIGDILVLADGAYIIAIKDIADILVDLLLTLKRFSKSSVKLIETQDLPQFEIKKEEIKIIIPSLRLDSIISELAHTSRSKAIELLNSERVFVNYEVETKPSKLLKTNDIITIRGKGKFEVLNIQGNTKSGNIILQINKYI